MLFVTDRAGQETGVEVPDGRTVMEVIRDAGYDDLLALCGGCCSCATCHVVVAPDFIPLLPEMSEDESDLLDTSSHRTTGSRLSCQIALTEALSGLRVTIAPEE